MPEDEGFENVNIGKCDVRRVWSYTFELRHVSKWNVVYEVLSSIQGLVYHESINNTEWQIKKFIAVCPVQQLLWFIPRVFNTSRSERVIYAYENIT
jgi:hypothetical protein